MKARIRKTSEIVNSKMLSEDELELLTNEDVHWQDIRECAAIAAMQGMLSNSKIGDTLYLHHRFAIPNIAVEYANELIKQLKQTNNEKN